MLLSRRDKQNKKVRIRLSNDDYDDDDDDDDGGKE